MASIHSQEPTGKDVTLAVEASQINPISDSSDIDIAFKYIQNASIGDIDTSTVDLPALRRRIELRLLPVLFLCAVVQYLDKVNLNYAAVMGLNADLHLRGNDFSNVATAFYVAYLIFEVPTGLMLQKLPVGKWLGGNLMAWGIVTACSAATSNYTTLLVVRIVLGVLEAAFIPCILLITSQWYTRSEQVPRFSPFSIRRETNFVDILTYFAESAIVTISSGIILTYSSTIIRNFGYTAKMSTLLSAPSGAVSLLANIIVAYGVTYITKGHRWVWIIASCIGGIIAGSLLSFSPSSNRAALLTGIYLVTTVTPTGILIYRSVTMTNVAGHTKRSVASAMIAASSAVGNIIGPQTFRAEDAPKYHVAKILFLATQAGGGTLTFVLFGYYVWANRQKERRQKSLVRGWRSILWRTHGEI